ncbi:MAG: hypothetical protein WBP81_05395 [Solirubrobacteraceae bacterium]
MLPNLGDTPGVEHAQGQTVRVRIATIPDRVGLLIVDDGIGFDMRQEQPGHRDPGTMQERARRIGGRLQVVSAAGQGTTVRLVIA